MLIVFHAYGCFLCVEQICNFLDSCFFCQKNDDTIELSSVDFMVTISRAMASARIFIALITEGYGDSDNMARREVSSNITVFLPPLCGVLKRYDY